MTKCLFVAYNNAVESCDAAKTDRGRMVFEEDRAGTDHQKEGIRT